MALLWTDGTWTTASQVGGVRFSSPIEGSNLGCVLECDWMQLAANWTATALGTAHATYTDYKLVHEDGFQDLGGGVVKWTRTYAKVPTTHYEYEPYTYSFIGFVITVNESGYLASGRERFSKTVMSQVTHAYTEASDPTDVTITPATRYYVGDDPEDAIDYLADSVSPYNPTTPTLTGYKAYITDASTNGWDAVAGGLLVAEDTVVSRWMGNIWLARTRRVLAQ